MDRSFPWMLMVVAGCRLPPPPPPPPGPDIVLKIENAYANRVSSPHTGPTCCWVRIACNGEQPIPADVTSIMSRCATTHPRSDETWIRVDGGSFRVPMPARCVGSDAGEIAVMLDAIPEGGRSQCFAITDARVVVSSRNEAVFQLRCGNR